MRKKNATKSITIIEVAKEAKTSTATVSRYINNIGIKKDAAMRVKAAIEKLDYVPNAGARQIASTKIPKAMFVVIPNILETKFAESLTSIIDICNIYHYRLTIIFAHKQDDIKREIDLCLKSKGQEYIIYFGSNFGFFTKDGYTDNNRILFASNQKEKDNFVKGIILARTAIKKSEGK